jgi:AcrR family transcriptional regulator
MKNPAPHPKARGRPRQFDRDAALEQATRLFWEKGYSGTSLNDLAEAMNVNPPSLYAAFGNKRDLFAEAISHYEQGPGGFASRALTEAPTARQAIERLLLDAAEIFSSPAWPHGCMVVLAATNCAEEDRDVQALLSKKRLASERAIRNRIAAGISAGELPAGTSAEALASFYAAVFQGMSIKAKDGAKKTELTEIAKAAMAAWPA